MLVFLIHFSASSFSRFLLLSSPAITPPAMDAPAVALDVLHSCTPIPLPSTESHRGHTGFHFYMLSSPALTTPTTRWNTRNLETIFEQKSFCFCNAYKDWTLYIKQKKKKKAQASNLSKIRHSREGEWREKSRGARSIRNISVKGWGFMLSLKYTAEGARQGPGAKEFDG